MSAKLPNGVTVELKFETEDRPIVREKDGVFFVGYLSHDEMCENPLESCDGLGKVYTAKRSHGSDVLKKFREAKGLDENWKPTRKPNPLAVSLDVYSHSGEVYAISGSAAARRFPDQQWDVGHGSAVWVPDVYAIENIWINAVRRLLPSDVNVAYKSKTNPDGTCIKRAPKPGEKPYFTDGTCIDERYSNRITLTMPGYEKGGYKSFKSAYTAALRRLSIKLPENFAVNLRAEAHLACELALGEFNEWLSGACFGICVEVFSDDGKLLADEACWGYVGRKHAKESLEDSLAGTMKSFDTEKIPQGAA